MENKYSSKQAAEMTGLSIHTLRYYEQIGLIGEIKRDEYGYRQYSESDIAWYQIIKYYRSMGMPIKEMQEMYRYLAERNHVLPVSTIRKNFLESYRVKLIDQIKDLEQAVEKIDYKIDLFKRLEELEEQPNEERNEG